MSPKRGDRAAPPAVGGEFELRFISSEAAAGWEQLYGADFLRWDRTSQADGLTEHQR